MDKTLIIVLDEFSEKVFEYSNVTMFDYGFMNETTYYDNLLNGYGTIDETIVTFSDTVGGFYRVTPDGTDYSFQRDLDFKNEGTFLDANGDLVYFYAYDDFVRADQDSEDEPLHGDWVIEAIQQSLQFPEKTEILAIDLDGAAATSHWSKAIQNITYDFDGTSYTEPALVTVLFDFLSTFDARFNTAAQNFYLPSALSASFGLDQVYDEELTALGYFESLGIPIFQASANTGQGGVDWGSVYQAVINVGAWNTAENGELMLSSSESIQNVSLAGDGYVVKDAWGTNFGTSFATPRIAAEFTNLVNGLIADLNAQGSTLSTFENTTFVPPQYLELVANAVDALTTDVKATFADPDLGSLVFSISDATLQANGLLPKPVPGYEAGLAGSALASVVLNTEAGGTGATEGPDVLIGGVEADTIRALGGNDMLTGGMGDDLLDGGAGIDTTVYSGSQSTYTLTLGPTSTSITDRRTDGNGTDTLVSIERLEFGSGAPEVGNGLLNMDALGAITTLNAQQLEPIIELYIAYFNRAPDAVGLAFWGNSFAKGIGLQEMAALFIDQDETRAAYPDTMSNETFATAVYNNVLGRQPDAEGFAFWVGLLNSGQLGRDTFILEVLGGAKVAPLPDASPSHIANLARDKQYLADKTDIGAYFAVHKGMSDLQDAAQAMALFDGTQSSIQTAISAIDDHYADALSAGSGDFLMPLIGVLEDPYAMG